MGAGKLLDRTAPIVLNQHIAAATDELAAYRELVDSIPTGIVVLELGPPRHVILRNAAAAGICARGGAIILTAHSFRFRDPRHEKWLKENIRLYRDAHPKIAREITIEGAEGQIAVTLKPLRHLTSPPCIVALLSRLSHRSLPTITKLRDLWGLTAAEAELGVALADSGNIRAAAKKRGITEGTARQYLKRIYNKADVRGQADLIRRLMVVGV
jgi:DNA-binding CsgD family transcriptional regulator